MGQRRPAVMRAPALAVSAVLLAASAGLAATAPPAHASAATTFDWAVATVTLPHSVTGTVEVRMTMTGTRAGDGPEVVGQATWMPSFGADASVWVAGPGPLTTSVTTPAGSRSVTAVPVSADGAPGFGVRCSPCAFGAGSEIRLLGFDTDARYDGVSATAVAGGETLPVTVTTGSGSRRIDAAGETANGTALATGEVAPPGSPVPASIGLAAGASTTTVTVPAGAVGALSSGCLVGECVESWLAPDGRTRTLHHEALVVEGFTDGTPFGFAGPAGSWQFAWSGVSRETAVAAYAPIGDDWTRFS